MKELQKHFMEFFKRD